MTAVCAGPGRARHEIQPEDRRLDVSIAIDWGELDERQDHAKTSSFCSFACLADWAGARGIQHDGRTVLKAEAAKDRP